MACGLSVASQSAHALSNLDNDPLAIALLNVVYAELERGYNALKGYDENKKIGIDDR